MKSETYNTDCLGAMRAMPDNAFDLAIVDPPYGIGNFVMASGSNPVNTRNYKQGLDWNDDTPDCEYFNELKRVSKNRVIWGANYYNCFESGGLVWWKDIGHPNMSQCEIASVSCQNKVDFVRIPWASGFHRQRYGETIHPCQKPTALYKWILQTYAKAGDTILDTHLGSGSSRIAAYDLGFDFTGYELDKDYFEAQEKRFANHIAQPKLFEPPQAIVIQEQMFV